MLANYIDEIIMLCVGAWATATGFGYMQFPGKDPFEATAPARSAIISIR